VIVDVLIHLKNSFLCLQVSRCFGTLWEQWGSC